jgi:hypothetical protein
VNISVYTVQPFQILFFHVYIRDQSFSLSLENSKPKVSFRIKSEVVSRK